MAIAIIAGVLALSGSNVPSAQAAKTAQCGTNTIFSEGVAARIVVRAKRIKCSTAWYLYGHFGWAMRHGWNCAFSDLEGECRKGRKKMSVVPANTQSISCGLVGGDYVDVEGGSQVEIVDVYGIDCAEAVAVIQECIPNRSLPGWSREKGREKGFQILKRGSQRIFMRGTAGGGPLCAH